MAGSPDYRGPTRRPQRFAGSDRQVRGLVMAVLRGSNRPVTAAELDGVWPDDAQRARALDGLVADGLVEPLARNHYRLPSFQAAASAEVASG
jgi:A/G-specific adenine glycosylase